MRAVKRIELAERDRVQLERIVRAAKSEACMIEPAQIVPCASQGLNGLEIAERVGCSEAEPNMGYAVSRSAGRDSGRECCFGRAAVAPAAAPVRRLRKRRS